MGAQRIGDERRESIVNKTPLAAETNRIIGGIEPTRYLKSIEKRSKISPAELDEFVATHLVPPASLRSSDFDSYFKQRCDALVRLIEEAMGKAVQRDVEEGHPRRPPITSTRQTPQSSPTRNPTLIQRRAMRPPLPRG